MWRWCRLTNSPGRVHVRPWIKFAGAGLETRRRCGHLPHIHISRSEEHTSELQSPCNLVCRLLLEKKKNHGQPRTAHTQTRTRGTWSQRQISPRRPLSAPREVSSRNLFPAHLLALFFFFF